MERQNPVHEIQLGAVRASIWEESALERSKFRVSISRVVRPGERAVQPDRFDEDDLPVIVEVADLAHLWICEQAELIA